MYRQPPLLAQLSLIHATFDPPPSLSCKDIFLWTFTHLFLQSLGTWDQGVCWKWSRCVVYIQSSKNYVVGHRWCDTEPHTILLGSLQNKINLSPACATEATGISTPIYHWVWFFWEIHITLFHLPNPLSMIITVPTGEASVEDPVEVCIRGDGWIHQWKVSQESLTQHCMTEPSLLVPSTSDISVKSDTQASIFSSNMLVSGSPHFSSHFSNPTCTYKHLGGVGHHKCGMNESFIISNIQIQ